MPKENRKRGKKHKKVKEEPQKISEAVEASLPALGPTWIKDVPTDETLAADAPFGFVDKDVKNYLTDVQKMIVEWSEEDEQRHDALPHDDAEDRRLFLSAAVSEMSGKELTISTDPECSVILERMIHSMDDYLIRQFMARLLGSFEILAKHRYGSHVCQTLLTLAPPILRRELSDNIASPPCDPRPSEPLVIDRMEELVIQACKELLPSGAALISDPFASHVLRAAILLLSVGSWEELESQNVEKRGIRSAKSMAYKERQPKMISILASSDGVPQNVPVPSSFRPLALSFLDTIRSQLGASSVRSLAFDKVASPTLQVLIKVEAEIMEPNLRTALINTVVPSLDSPDKSDRDYVARLMRDPTSSHLVEKAIGFVSDHAFKNIWDGYFDAEIVSLAAHPVANFVIARAIERADEQAIQHCLQESRRFWPDCVRNSRTGVIKAIIDRVAVLHVQEAQLVDAISSTFGIEGSSRSFFIHCVMCLLPLKEYKLKSQKENPNEESMYGNRAKSGSDRLAPKIQGALLLQSLLYARPPANDIVLDSLEPQTVEELIQLAQNPISSRVLDVVLTSPTTPSRNKRHLITKFNGHFHTLADDRIGSRVAERLWDAADPFLQEKIARGLFTQEDFLAASQYGKHFLRKLNLWLLKRRPSDWKTYQDKQRAATREVESMVSSGEASLPHPSLATSSAPMTPQNKRKRVPTDEIDDLFKKSKPKQMTKGRKVRISDEEEMA